MAFEAEGDQAPVITKSDRDTEDVGRRFQRWLEGRLGGVEVTIDSFDSPERNGMSSETLLVDATWGDGDDRETRRMVIRMEPPATAVPVFPRYELEAQFQTMRLVGQECDAPVPEVLWFEADPEAIGAPFFVMSRVDGDVPPDVMPYNMGSWVTEATAEQRARLESATVAVLAEIHAVGDLGRLDDVLRTFTDESADAADTSRLRRHFEDQRRYYHWVMDGHSVPVLDEAFAHLDANWPSESSPVLCWGDSRIGNIMYQDFEPVAVLDWEMAAVAPAEVDVAWMVFLHRFFEDICVAMEMPGLPDFLPRNRVEAAYEAATGRQLEDMDWYYTYAALRHGIVMARVTRRSMHFGDAPSIDITDPGVTDSLVMHAQTLRDMMAGTYWDRVPG